METRERKAYALADRHLKSLSFPDPARQLGACVVIQMRARTPPPAGARRPGPMAMALLLSLQGIGLVSSLTVPSRAASSFAKRSRAVVVRAATDPNPNPNPDPDPDPNPSQAMSGSSDPGGSQYITPIGPFCPFRSEATKLDGTVDSGMGSLTSKSQSFMAEMARLQLESQMGSEPDPAKVEAVADDLAAALEEWELLMTRLGLGLGLG